MAELLLYLAWFIKVVLMIIGETILLCLAIVALIFLVLVVRAAIEVLRGKKKRKDFNESLYSVSEMKAKQEAKK